MAVAKPIIRQIKDNSESLDFFETVSLPSEDEKTRENHYGFSHSLYT